MHASFLIDSPPSILFIKIKNPSRLNAMITRIKRKSVIQLGLFFNLCIFKTAWKFGKSIMYQLLGFKPDWSFKQSFTQGE